MIEPARAFVWCVLISLLAVVRGAAAAPPSGYSCGAGGKVIKDQGCRCPTGKAPARDAENTAICVAKAVEPDHPTAANACMKDRKGRYQVKIDSTPPGATVYIGDRSCGVVGYTPWAGLLNAGPAIVILEKEGYTATLRTIDGKTANALRLLLAKASTSIGISSQADKNIEGAKVSIDGLVIGAAPLVKIVTPGRHLIELAKPGFEKFSQWIEVKANDRTTLSPTLVVTPSLKAVGKLRIVTTTPGAHALVNGIDRGRTPLELELEVGRYIVRLQLPGHRSYEEIVEIEGGKTKVLSRGLVAY